MICSWLEVELAGYGERCLVAPRSAAERKPFRCANGPRPRGCDSRAEAATAERLGSLQAGLRGLGRLPRAEADTHGIPVPNDGQNRGAPGNLVCRPALETR